MTHINSKIYASDGSSKLTIVDSTTFKTESQLQVAYQHQPLKNLNELEYCSKDGLIYANVWFSYVVYGIDPKSGVAVK